MIVEELKPELIRTVIDHIRLQGNTDQLISTTIDTTMEALTVV